jgi:hypothetical protein
MTPAASAVVASTTTMGQRPSATPPSAATPARSGAAGVRNNNGTVNASFATIAEHQASIAGGGIANGAGTFTIRGTILAANTADNCTGTATSAGNNLDSGTTCSLPAGELSNSNPLLGPLAANGGPTATHALLPGSPAQDSGGTAGCPPTDQRGTSRPQGSACDIGAYEAS